MLGTMWLKNTKKISKFSATNSLNSAGLKLNLVKYILFKLHFVYRKRAVLLQFAQMVLKKNRIDLCMCGLQICIPGPAHYFVAHLVNITPASACFVPTLVAAPTFMIYSTRVLFAETLEKILTSFGPVFKLFSRWSCFCQCWCAGLLSLWQSKKGVLEIPAIHAS